MIQNRSFILLFLLSVFFAGMFSGCRSSEVLAEEEQAAETDIPQQEETADEPEPEPAEETELPIGTLKELVPAPMEEFRGVWVASVANIDWPSRPGLPVEQQKKELVELLDKAASLHFNAVIFQVRPAADALYASPLEPWSYYLTGNMGQSPLPEYDPLEFAIQEAHKRGLALHAWFNPYRASHPAGNAEISPDHISKTHPEYVVKYGNYLWLDPGNEDARNHTLNVILDVVKRYDIDGVHFDDYFYPYPSYANGADFPDGRSWQKAQANGNQLSRGDWRRENVNILMRELSEKIKEIKPHVKFGISPFGIWRPGYPENTTGFDAYENLYADARLWLQEGWVDYFTPQIYYRIEQTGQPFPVMLEWWAEQNLHQRHLWPGLFTSRLRTTDITWPAEEITGQVYTARGFPGVTGAVHFSMKVFLENSAGFNRKINAGPYAFPSVLPATPWLGNTAPQPPEITFRDDSDFYSFNINNNPDEDVRWWIVQKRYGGLWDYDIVPSGRNELRYYGGAAMARPDEVQIAAVSRTGIKSLPAVLFPEKQPVRLPEDTLSANMVKRTKWAQKSPGGREADAVRLVVSEGDTLQFRNLVVVAERMIRSAPFPPHLQESAPSAAGTGAEGSETIRLQLMKDGVLEGIQIEKGEAFNWYGYHIGILETDFEAGHIEIEIATATSVSVDRASRRTVGGPGERFRVPHRPQRITLHQTACEIPVEEEDDTEEFLNNLFDWGFSEKNWWDVPYHYIVDADGTIFEGRGKNYAADTAWQHDSRGDLRIGVMGEVRNSAESGGQLRSIAELIAKLLKQYHLPANHFGTVENISDSMCPAWSFQTQFTRRTFLRMVEEAM